MLTDIPSYILSTIITLVRSFGMQLNSVMKEPCRRHSGSMRMCENLEACGCSGFTTGENDWRKGLINCTPMTYGMAFTFKLGKDGEKNYTVKSRSQDGGSKRE